MPVELEVCAYCPRLCRHVCPVAVATGDEAATPTAMSAGLLLARAGALGEVDATELTRLCLSCGACTDHCKHHVPVALQLGRPAPPRRDAPAAAPPGAIRFVPCGSGVEPAPHQLACCGRNEGFDEREPEAARRVAEENVRRLAGRAAVCSDGLCTAWLVAHGARMEVG